MSGDPWAGRLLPARAGPLPVRLDALLRSQRAAWPRLAEATAALERVRTRTLDLGKRRVVVQWNPGRRASTTARVDAEAIRRRPCFLCPANQPAEERGLAFGDGWVVLPNPAPILPGHLVVAHREHRPQAPAEAVGALLDFPARAGGRWTAVFNGPRSGASAPDHLHFQAVASGRLPEEEATRGRSGAWVERVAGRVVLGAAGERRAVERALRAGIEAAAEAGADVNLLAFADGDALVGLLFPRGAHRPRAWAEGRLLVSPGAIDVAGVVVTVRASDLQALDAAAVRAIFEEVSLSPAAEARFRAALRRRGGPG